MDKNIVAFLREDARTIGVRFFKDNTFEKGEPVINLDLGSPAAYPVSPKEYTYLTNLTDLQVGDFVIVMVSSVPKVVLVTSVHEELAIEPNESTQYKWIVDKVDMESYMQEQRKNRDLSQLLALSYKANMKQQFRQAILGSVDDVTVKRITDIMQGGTGNA